MSKLDPREQINRASWTIVEAVKDSLAANLLQASTQGKMPIKGDDLAKLLVMVNASVEEGGHKASRTFNRTVDAIVSKLEQELPAETPPRTKKK
jgi:hypothetical protein